MRRCSKCTLEKDETEFRFDAKRNRFYYHCLDCQREYGRSHYGKNKVKVREKVNVARQKRRIDAMQFVISHLQLHPCIDCGESDPVVLDFDHISDKRESVSVLSHGDFSILSIQEEIEKCEVRCANCHRKKTARDFNYRRFRMLNIACAN